MMKTLLASSLCLLSFWSAPQAQALADTPERAVKDGIDAIRLNDVLGYVRLSTTDQQFAEMQRSWDSYRAEKPDGEQVVKFAEVIAILTSPDAEDTVMALLEPKLAEWRPQMAMMTGMFTAMAQM